MNQKKKRKKKKETIDKKKKNTKTIRSRHRRRKRRKDKTPLPPAKVTNQPTSPIRPTPPANIFFCKINGNEASPTYLQIPSLSLCTKPKSKPNSCHLAAHTSKHMHFPFRFPLPLRLPRTIRIKELRPCFTYYHFVDAITLSSTLPLF